MRDRRAARRREAKLHHAMRSVAADMVGMDELIRRLGDWSGTKNDSGEFLRRPATSHV